MARALTQPNRVDERANAAGALAHCVIVVPNAGHRLDAPAYKARYPSVVTFCPRGGRARIAEVVSVDGTYDDYVDDGTVRFETLDGVDASEGALFVRSEDGVTVVLNDVVMNMTKKKNLLVPLHHGARLSPWTASEPLGSPGYVKDQRRCAALGALGEHARATRFDRFRTRKSQAVPLPPAPC